jgi:hypothetical protein
LKELKEQHKRELDEKQNSLLGFENALSVEKERFK